MSEAAMRTAIVEVNSELERRGYAGTMACRSRRPAAESTLAPEHIVFTRFDGTWHGSLRRSSEFAMHRSVYQHAVNANAVVHTHADHCVALSTFRQPIPAFHYMINGFGGMDVPCVDYHPFGLGNPATIEVRPESLGARRSKDHHLRV